MNLPTVDTVEDVQPYLRDHEERLRRLESMVSLPTAEPMLAWDAGRGSPRFISSDLACDVYDVGQALLNYLDLMHENGGENWADSRMQELVEAFDTQLDILHVALTGSGTRKVDR